MRYINGFSVFAAAIVSVTLMTSCNHNVTQTGRRGFSPPPNSVNVPIDHPDNNGHCTAPDETDLVEQKQQAFWYPRTDKSDVFTVNFVHCPKAATATADCAPGCGTPFRVNDIDQYDFTVTASGTASGLPVKGKAGKCYKYEISHKGIGKRCNDPNVIVK